MRIRLWLIVACAAGLFGTAERVRAGSFFGPCCYGARYTEQYPNRSHNVFGCGPCGRCAAWHPFFGGHFRKKQAVPADGVIVETSAPPLAQSGQSGEKSPF